MQVTAAEQFDLAIELTKGYLSHIKRERENAEEAVEISKQLLSGELGEVDDEIKSQLNSEHLIRRIFEFEKKAVEMHDQTPHNIGEV